jgi:hypothetical protein
MGKLGHYFLKKSRTQGNKDTGFEIQQPATTSATTNPQELVDLILKAQNSSGRLMIDGINLTARSGNQSITPIYYPDPSQLSNATSADIHTSAARKSNPKKDWPNNPLFTSTKDSGTSTKDSGIDTIELC